MTDHPTETSEALGPTGELTLRTLAMPRDVNTNGDIFGGWVLSQMDMAAGIVASSRAQGRVATVAIDAMKFIRPVKVGDVLCIYVHLARIGRSDEALLPGEEATRIRQPALLLWCKQDVVIDSSALDLYAQRIPQGSKVLLDDCGHMSLMERPREVADAVVKLIDAK